MPYVIVESKKGSKSGYRVRKEKRDPETGKFRYFSKEPMTLEMAKKHQWKVLAADLEGEEVSAIKKENSLPIALLLSRESQGLREEAKNLFTSVSIQMSSHVNSLNVASAGAILLYELKEIL